MFNINKLEAKGMGPVVLMNKNRALLWTATVFFCERKKIDKYMKITEIIPNQGYRDPVPP
jgi:hypothetical protein